jgi:thiosulfate reductase cytochrome b subunit
VIGMTMTASNVGSSADALIFRHSALVRVTHWVNVLCLSFLLLSGLQIFNAHPALYWGQYGADHDPSFLGASHANGELTVRGFPSWLTIPSYQDLASGRRWHFFFAWLFVINGLVYLLHSLAAGHVRRDLKPTRRQLTLRSLAHEIADHARLRFPKGQAARHYNALQKLAYLVVIFIVLPLIVATGLTMSPGIDAAVPWLLDLFGGRQSARTIHFLTASALVAFVVIHVVMVMASGTWNNMQSMITGYYAIKPERPRS